MDTKRILSYLKQLMANNNRDWFWEHKAEYDAVRADFEAGIEMAINRIASFDPSIAHLTVKDCTYRFNRDTRFSPDKSPYKNHFGGYIAAHGKKALHGGYYLHLEPGHCMVACGNYWLPTNILTSCRNEMMGNTAAWLKLLDPNGCIELGPAPGLWTGETEEMPSGIPQRLALRRVSAHEGLLLLASGARRLL